MKLNFCFRAIIFSAFLLFNPNIISEPQVGEEKEIEIFFNSCTLPHKTLNYMCQTKGQQTKCGLPQCFMWPVISLAL